MENQKKLCNSIFKSGIINKEIYTAVWITLVNRLIKNEDSLFAEEKKG